MERSSKPAAKSKGPRVLANTVKKPDKGLNTSANRSFAKKSSSHYIQDLRTNNARLAHSLAVEKAKYGAIARKYVENEKLHLHQQAEFRTIARNIKIGVKHLDNSIESMCQGITILSEVNDKLNSLWPETTETVLPQASVVDANLPCSSGSTTVPKVGDNRSVASQTAPSPKTSASSPKHYTAMPMVKGQVISKPTISLSRVNVPMGLGNRNGVQRQPTRDTFVDNAVRPDRLSVVSEEMDVSGEESANTTRMSSSPNQHSTLVSGPCSINSLPASHVLLHRIESDFMLPSNSATAEQNVDDDQDQLTMVCFGNIGYNNLNDTLPVSSMSASSTKSPTRGKQNTTQSPDTLPVSSMSASSTKSPSRGKQNTTPSPDKSKINSSDSNEYETESSDDDDLALQLVESKKSYTERKRQLDSKEGTSWNYDDAGKYHGRPPKRKKSAKNSTSSEMSSSLAKPKSVEHTKDNVSTLKERRTRTSSEQVVSPKLPTKDTACSSQSTVSENGKILKSPKNDVNDALLMDTTTLDDMDMSFTCVTNTRLPYVQVANQSEASPERPEQSFRLSEQQQDSERKVFITQRSRGRKPLPDSPDSPNLRHSSLSPLSSSRRAHSVMENNENSPPSPVLSTRDKWSTVSDIPEGLSQLPNVVLERLPSNIISGKIYLSECSDSSVHHLNDSHPSHSINRFKCQLANSVSNTGVNKQHHEDSGNLGEKTQLIKTSKTKERQEVIKPGSPKVTHIESHSSHSDSGANAMEEESSTSLGKKRMKEHSSNATKSKNRSTKSEKSLEGSGTSANSSSKGSNFPNKEGLEQGKEPEMAEQSADPTKSKKRSAKSEKSLDGSHTGANSSSTSIQMLHSDSVSEHGCTERPKRNAAPTNLKEPKCNLKLRRT